MSAILKLIRKVLSILNMSLIFKIFKQNLSLLLPRQNHNEIITRMFNEELISTILLTFRLNFPLSDYYFHRVSINFVTLKPAFLITTISWLTISVFLSMIFFPNNQLLITTKHYEEMFKTPALNLLFSQLVIMFMILEYLSFFYMKETLMYRCSLIDLLAVDIPVQEKKFTTKMRQNLIKLFVIINFIATITYLNMIILILSISILMNYLYLPFYLDNRITMIQFSTCFLLSMLLVMKIISLAFQLCTSGKLFLFYLLFFIYRIKQLYRISWSIIIASLHSSYLAKKRFWFHFFREYIILYGTTVRLNRSVKVALLIIELINKSLVIFGCVFYSKQTGMTVVNAVFIMTAILTFIFTNFTYSRIARIPEYNRKSAQYLLQWLSRSQFHNTRLDASIKRMVELRPIIKSNLFVQTMTNNQLGFTCGHLFYITKYKYNELILMNISLILMFYKQISNLD
ncbi:hypothetical protein HUG17_9149 [Dermatophagoides farinae]|uniref:Uncharacterized protein n=1 Tax=Dermatophagoides farinae TaxID=6954 RepID=A0A9D4NTN2_DERFA|nr:hypothetical protein HUG17_9149 [Dermatophagoides farinae]